MTLISKTVSNVIILVIFVFMEDLKDVEIVSIQIYHLDNLKFKMEKSKEMECVNANKDIMMMAYHIIVKNVTILVITVKF